MSSHALCRSSIVVVTVAQIAILEYYLMVMRIGRIMGRCDSQKVWKLQEIVPDYEWR